MELTMLGTGHAMVTECYNTCFILKEKQDYFLVDGGGGNQLLSQLKKTGINWKEIRTFFVTHKHIDHVMGIIWMIRMICQSMREGSYEGEARIYAHEDLITILKNVAEMLLWEKDLDYLGERLHLIPLQDGEECRILGHPTKFFDIHSTKERQFGFTMYLGDHRKLTCLGDEPYQENEEEYVKGSTWLLHEAFCLYGEAEIFKPYEKHHSTVKDACELAEQMGVENLLLYHTEDKNIENRKALYTEEGSQYFHGKIYVPEDLEVLKI